MKIYNRKNNFEGLEVFGLADIEESLREARMNLRNFTYIQIIEEWSKIGQKIIKDKDLISREGVLYLARWLRKENLLNFIVDSLGGNLEGDFIKLRAGGEMIAQPRGIVVHWTAGNTITFPIIALAQSTIVKNSSIMRASKNNLEFTIKVMKIINNLNSPLSKILLDNITIVYFPHEEIENHIILSKIADCKAIWGGSKTIRTLKNLPEKDNCENIIFGPKYSMAVIDRDSQFSDELRDNLDKLALDIIAFDQMACSSPQIIFIEKGGLELGAVAEILSASLSKLSLKYPKRLIREDIASKIVIKRCEFLLDPSLDLISSKENDWSILVGGEVKLEEAIQSRTVFIKEINQLEDIAKLINPKIQTVCMIAEKSRKKLLAKNYFYNGVARCVPPGETNYYDWPWDGMNVLSRLVRWCRLS